MVVGGLLSLAVFGLYAVVAFHLVGLFTPERPDGPLGSDPLTSAEAFFKLKFEWKHPLMSPVGRAATALIGFVPGLDRTAILVGAIALLAALATILFFVALVRILGDRLAAAAGALIFSVSFTSLCLLGIPESYAASSLAIFLFLLVWGQDETVAKPGAGTQGLLVGLAGLGNLPLLALAGVPPLRVLLDLQWRRALWVGLVVGAVAVLVTGGVLFTYGWLKYGGPFGYAERAAGYAAGYADPSRLLDPDAWTQVLVCFFLFALASPVPAVPGRLHSSDLPMSLADLTGVVGLAGAVLALLLALAAVLGPRWRTAMALWAWLAGMTAFHVYFNPLDAMLYSIQTQGVVVLLAALGATSLAPPRLACLLLLVIATMLAARNLPILLGGPYAFA